MTLWCMRLIGPDEWIAMPSREAAETAVVAHSRAFERFVDARPGMRAEVPPPWVEVAEWPWDAKSHAQALEHNAIAAMEAG